MNSKQENEKYFYFIIMSGALILAANLYYYCHPLLSSMRLTNEILDSLFMRLHDGGVFTWSFKTKFLALLLICPCLLARTGRMKSVPKKTLAVVGGVGAVLYFIPSWWPSVYLLTTLAGSGMVFWTFGMLSRITSRMQFDQMEETFPQCEKLIETDFSVNLPTRYIYEGQLRKGWINLISLDRGLMVMGNPGSGKSYSVFEPCIETLIRKKCSMLLYDFKFPTLTVNAFNQYLKYYDTFDVKPEFCVINFSDPRTSMRFNPFNPEYLQDPADASEVAEIVMQNVNNSTQKKEDFFTDAGRLYFDAATWFLRIYEDGKYCTFPHVLELVSRKADDVVQILNSYPEIRVKATPFAASGKATEQLTGMITSAQVPIVKLADRTIYWILSGDDGSLDINDPDSPKILCLGNQVSRQAINSAALALYTSRIFKSVNQPGRCPCAILIDELPTMILKGLDTLAATGRSNGIFTCLGMQDLSQLVRDYGDKAAEVIFNNVANIVCGQVGGKTADRMSKMFGKADMTKESETIGRSNDSVSISRQKEELMPVSRISTLSQGEFVGKMADTMENPIKQKLFCAKIIRDDEAVKAEKSIWKTLPVMTDFGEDEAEEDVRNNPHRYLVEYFERKVMNSGIGYDSDQLREEAERRLAATSDADRNRIIRSIVRKARKKAVSDALDNNMMRIKHEIDMIISSELMRLHELRQSTDPRLTDGLHGI